MSLVYFRYSLIFIVVSAFVTLTAVLFAINRNQEVANITNTIDETKNWIKHDIASKIRRGNVSLAIGDINGDKKTDVLICLGNRNSLQPTDGIWWFEAPDWTFRRISSPDMPIRWSLALTVGDVDNDDDLDVVALSFDDSNVYLAINPLNQGGALNKPWQTIKILESPGIHRDGERLELIDLDNDGYLDVLFSRGRPAEVRVLFNPAGVLTNRWENKFIGFHGGSDSHDVISADLDLDGDLDIISASGDKTWLGRVFWYEHPNNETREGTWKRHIVSGGKITRELHAFASKLSTLNQSISKVLGFANYGGLQIDDIDADGRIDIIVTEAHGTPGKVLWFKNPKKPLDIWTEFVIGTQNFPHASLSFDVDGDDVKELWVPDASFAKEGKYGHRSGGIVYYKLIDAENNEWSKHIVALAPEVGRQSWSVDMDGDGDLDVVSTSDHAQNNDSIVWWENRLD